MLQPETLRPETLNLYGKLSTNEAGGTFCMEPLPINIEARTNSSLRTAVLVEASVKLQGGLVRSWWSDQTLLDGLGFRVYWLNCFRQFDFCQEQVEPRSEIRLGIRCFRTSTFTLNPKPLNPVAPKICGGRLEGRSRHSQVSSVCGPLPTLVIWS